MSKPKPIEYYISWWELSYQKEPYDSSKKTAKYHYKVSIKYIADLPDDKYSVREVWEIFQTFEQAKECLDKELES